MPGFYGGIYTSTQKPTSSARKLAEYARIRELDKAAMVLIRQGIGVAEAYRIALQDDDRVPGYLESSGQNVLEYGGGERSIS